MSTKTPDHQKELTATLKAISLSLNVSIDEFVSDDGKTLDVHGLSNKLIEIGVIDKSII